MSNEVATVNGHSPLLTPALTPPVIELVAEVLEPKPEPKPVIPQVKVRVNFKRSLGEEIDIDVDLDQINFDVFAQITALQDSNVPEIERVGQLMDVLTPLCGKDMRKVPTYISFEVLNQIVAHFGGIMQVQAKN